MKLTETEKIKNAAYTAQTMHKMCIEGKMEYNKAKSIILKHGKGLDFKKYFNKEVSGHGPIMADVTLRKDTEKEAWEAFEYFDLI